MKKLLVVLFLFISFSIMGQELTKYFAGVIYTGSYNRDLKVSHNANLRLAGEFTPDSSFYFRGVYTSENKNLVQVWWTRSDEFTETKIGFMPRPISFLNRPNPITAGAQFEPGGLSVIPGGALGTLITTKLYDGKLHGGVYYLPSEKLLEYNFGLDYNPIGISGFYSEKNWGVAGTLKISDLLTLTNYYGSEKYSAFVNVILGNSGAPYSWVVYDRIKKTWSSEIGWTKEWKIKEIPDAYVLIGLGYLPEAKILNFYFWVHL